MKAIYLQTKIVLIFLVLSGLSFNGYPQWSWRNPLPQGNGIYDFSFTKDGTVFICGEIGSISKATEGYNKWVQQSSGTTAALFQIKFVSNDVGYAVGYEYSYGVFLKTINGGTSWSVADTLSRVICLSFPSADTGFVGGENLYKTCDGGNSFSILPNNPCGQILSVCCLSTSVIYTCGETGLFISYNGGSTWDSLYCNPGIHLRSVQFINQDSGFILGLDANFSNPLVYKTTNAGLTWENSTPPVNTMFRAMHFINPRKGVVVGDSGSIFITSDGGNSWQNRVSGTTLPLYSVRFYDDLNGIAGGAYGLTLKTSDGGDTWTLVSSSLTYSDLNAVSFITPKIGFTAGDKGIIMKTVDSGLTWCLKPSGTLSPLYSIFFIDSLTGFIVGDKILRTHDGGETWIASQTPYGSHYNYLSVMFPNRDTGYILGYWNELLRTTDGGITWAGLAPPPFMCSSMFFTNAKTGYLVGRHGVILKTINGGISWNTCQTGVIKGLWSVTFINENTGFAAGEGIILKTTDQGVNWASKYNSSEVFKSICFADSTTGYALSYNSFFRTADKGETWELMDPVQNANQYLNSQFFINADTGIVVGINGFILRTATGGKKTAIGEVRTKQNSLLIFPNPSNGNFEISFEKSLKDCKVVIFDMNGHLQFSKYYLFPSTKIQLKLNDLKSGIYIIRVISNEGTRTGKVMIFN